MPRWVVKFWERRGLGYKPSSVLDYVVVEAPDVAQAKREAKKQYATIDIISVTRQTKKMRGRPWGGA